MKSNNSNFSIELKSKLVLENIINQKSIDEIAEENNLSYDLVSIWKERFLEIVSIIFNETDKDLIINRIQSILKDGNIDYQKSIFEKLVLENTKSLVNICDIDTHEVFYLNPTCKKAYDIKEDCEYLNKKCYEVFYKKDSPCSFCTNEKLTSKGIHVWKAHNPIKQRYYELTDQLIQLDGRNLRLEVGVDVSEKHNQIKFLGEKVHLDETLFDCIKTLTENKDLNQAIEKMLEIVCKYYNGNRSYIFELSEDGTLLDNTYEWCEEGISAEIDNLQNIPKEVAGYWFE